MEDLTSRKMEIIFKEDGFKQIAEKICSSSTSSGFKNLALTNKTISNFCKNFAVKKCLRNEQFVSLVKVAKDNGLEENLKNIFIRVMYGDCFENFQNISPGKKSWTGKYINRTKIEEIKFI